MDKIFYNESSAVKLGWSPDWFGASHFDEELLKKVKKFQQEHGLTADGLVGPTTYRRIWTERKHRLPTIDLRTLPTGTNLILSAITIMLRLIGLVLCFQLKRMA